MQAPYRLLLLIAIPTLAAMFPEDVVLRPARPLTAEWMPGQDTYRLDFEGDTPEDYRMRLLSGEVPDGPEVDLRLRLTNASRQTLTIRDPEGRPNLDLQGPGVIRVTESVGLVAGWEAAPLTLAPGASHTIAIRTFANSPGDRSYWALPGNYLVAGIWRLSVAPAPPGIAKDSDGFASVTLPLPPLRLKVLPPAPVVARKPWDRAAVHRPPAPGTVIPPRPENTSEVLRRELARPVNFEPGIAPETALTEALEILNDRYGFGLRIDEEAFAKAARQRIGAVKVGCSALPRTTFQTIVERMMNPLDAGLEVRDGKPWIVPLAVPQGLADRLPPAYPWFRKRLRCLVPAGTKIPEGATLNRALEILTEGQSLPFVVDAKAFARAGVPEIEKSPVKFRLAEPCRLGDALDDLLGSAGAAFVVRREAIVVVPARR